MSEQPGDEKIKEETETSTKEKETESSVEKSSIADEEQLESLLERELRVQGTASLFELKKHFEFKVVGLAGIKYTEPDPSAQVYVQAALYDILG